MSGYRAYYPRTLRVLVGKRKGEEEFAHVAANSSSPLYPLHLTAMPSIVRPSYRVLIPQSVHLTALIFSLRFMKMSAYSRASPRARAMRKTGRRAPPFANLARSEASAPQLFLHTNKPRTSRLFRSATAHEYKHSMVRYHPRMNHNDQRARTDIPRASSHVRGGTRGREIWRLKISLPLAFSPSAKARGLYER